VDQSGGLECVSDSLLLQIAMSLPMQFRIDQFEESLSRIVVRMNTAVAQPCRYLAYCTLLICHSQAPFVEPACFDQAIYAFDRQTPYFNKIVTCNVKNRRANKQRARHLSKELKEKK
jgi:hypothetical protein